MVQRREGKSLVTRKVTISVISLINGKIKYKCMLKIQVAIKSFFKKIKNYISKIINQICNIPIIYVMLSESFGTTISNRACFSLTILAT